MASASDSEILDAGRAQDRIVLTLDADFHAEMALSGASRPSVVRIRIEGLRGEALSLLVQNVAAKCGKELAAGALISVEPGRIRVRRLPISGSGKKPRKKS
ncbi:MAG: hypothetical protein FD180_839 [Planctomycetota bacterium]|nr:MAG: hypothetical protein FD180_839 [Planctomycetota bacterium]